jgi:protein-export membrane protein SecD
MAFMILVYRLPGFVASIALVAYTAIMVILVVVLRVNLSLPGIAGIILTIGMAVDANVVIYERIKEELAFGKSVKAAVKAGFSRAFTAILDSNITTLIAAAVLYYFGTGTIKGFAITLFIGTIVSMFTAIFVTKFLLKQMVGLNIRNPKLYCPAKGGNKNV